MHQPLKPQGAQADDMHKVYVVLSLHMLKEICGWNIPKDAPGQLTRSKHIGKIQPLTAF